jgi:hypothetical protein
MNNYLTKKNVFGTWKALLRISQAADYYSRVPQLKIQWKKKTPFRVFISRLELNLAADPHEISEGDFQIQKAPPNAANAEMRIRFMWMDDWT